MNNQQITNRLNDLRSAGLDISNKESKIYKDLKVDEAKISHIVHCVHNGVSRISRLKTADKLLTKWGF